MINIKVLWLIDLILSSQNSSDSNAEIVYNSRAFTTQTVV